LIFCDAQAYAHQRRFGLACHLGVLLDVPSMGVPKSLLVGEYKELALSSGSPAALIDSDTGEQVGAAVHTANSVKPVYVSQGTVSRSRVPSSSHWHLGMDSVFRNPRARPIIL
jgi:deoxyribonuclease V